MKRIPPFLRWHIPVVIVFYLLWQHHTSSTGDWVDKLIAAELAITFGYSALVLIIGRRPNEWSPRAAGLMFTSVATSVLFTGTLYLYIHDLPLYRPDIQASPPLPMTAEAAVDVARAYFLVGGPLLGYGLTVWTVAFFRQYHRLPNKVESESGFYLTPTGAEAPRLIPREEDLP